MISRKHLYISLIFKIKCISVRFFRSNVLGSEGVAERTLSQQKGIVNNHHSQ